MIFCLVFSMSDNKQLKQLIQDEDSEEYIQNLKYYNKMDSSYFDWQFIDVFLRSMKEINIDWQWRGQIIFQNKGNGSWRPKECHSFIAISVFFDSYEE